MPTTQWATFGNGIDNILGASKARARAVLGFAVDLDNNRIWVKVSTDSSAQWNRSGTANPTTNTGGTDITSINNGVSVMPAFSGFFASSVADTAILNAGATAFWMAAPSGFSAWDSTGTTTWNPSDKSTSITLSNGNLTASQATTGSGWRSVRAVGSSKHTGKWYFEVLCDQRDASDGWMAGIMNASASLTSFVGADNNGIGYQSQQSSWKNGSSTGLAIATLAFSTWRSVLGTSASRHSGKWYFEAVCDAVSSSNGWMLGVGNASMSLANFAGHDTNGAAFQNISGTMNFWRNNSSGGVVIAGITQSHNLGVAVDLDNNRMWCRVDGGTWSGTSGNPATNTGGSDITTINDGASVMPAWAGFCASGIPEQATLITTGTAYSPPSGFTVWDSTVTTAAKQNAVSIISKGRSWQPSQQASAALRSRSRPAIWLPRRKSFIAASQLSMRSQISRAPAAAL